MKNQNSNALPVNASKPKIASIIAREFKNGLLQTLKTAVKEDGCRIAIPHFKFITKSIISVGTVTMFEERRIRLNKSTEVFLARYFSISSNTVTAEPTLCIFYESFSKACFKFPALLDCMLAHTSSQLNGIFYRGFASGVVKECGTALTSLVLFTQRQRSTVYNW